MGGKDHGRCEEGHDGIGRQPRGRQEHRQKYDRCLSQGWRRPADQSGYRRRYRRHPTRRHLHDSGYLVSGWRGDGCRQDPEAGYDGEEDDVGLDPGSLHDAKRRADDRREEEHGHQGQRVQNGCRQADCCEVHRQEVRHDEESRDDRREAGFDADGDPAHRNDQVDASSYRGCRHHCPWGYGPGGSRCGRYPQGQWRCLDAHFDRYPAGERPYRSDPLDRDPCHDRPYHDRRCHNCPCHREAACHGQEDDGRALDDRRDPHRDRQGPGREEARGEAGAGQEERRVEDHIGDEGCAG